MTYQSSAQGSTTGQLEHPVRLNEHGWIRHLDLSPEEAADIQRTRKVDVAPSVDQPGKWDLHAHQFVGMIRVGTRTIWIDTKVPINNVLYMLSFAKDISGWSTEAAEFAEERYLVGAIAHGLLQKATVALRPSLLQGYVTVEDAYQGIKGRMRTAAQVSRRFALPLPIEITFDEFTTDIAENRILKAAAARLLLVAGLPKTVTARLRELLLVLRDVGELAGREAETIVYNRLNQRYRDAIRLASLILNGASITFRGGAVSAVAFLLDMNKAFEDFVTEVARGVALPPAVSFASQHSRWLDTENRMDFRPDLSWWIGPRCVAVADVKYKATQGEQVPSGDIYQMLAYCLVHQLPTGYLIYAKGEADAWEYEIRQSGITVAVRTLDLSGAGPQVRLRCELLIQNLMSAA